MDEWLKKKKAASNGGLGMSKFVDYAEQKRLSRLKNIRGSINQSMQHNTWQASQLEKRRKEQIRQRKREAKKRAEKKDFQVDTGCAATPYAFTKCGLKLRLEKSSSTTAPEKKSRTKAKREVNNDHKPETERKQLPLVSQYAIDSIELNRRKPAPARDNVTKQKEDVKVKVSKQSGGVLKVGQTINSMKKKEKTNIKSNTTERHQNKDSDIAVTLARDNSRISDSSSSRSSGEGKENGDNSNRSEESDSVEAKRTLPRGKQLQRKKPMKKSTDSYFMDFASLKREHADAIEMLKQLDEENKRLFVKKDGGGFDFDAEWATEQEEKEEDVEDDAGEESLAVTLPEGMLHATHLSISLHEIEGGVLQDDIEVDANLGDELAGGLDDESDAENSYSNSSRSKQELDDDNEQDFEDSGAEEVGDTDMDQ